MHRASTSDHIWTVLELIRWGTEYFTSKGIDSPRLTIELLLCHVLNLTRVKLYTEFERPLIREELDALKALIERRVKHEPLQYILGTTDFYGLKFKVDKRVLIPRPETEILVDLAVAWCKNRESANLWCLDIGTGSGCIAIAIAHQVPSTRWLCIDESTDALDVASENSIQLHVADRIIAQCLDFRSTVPEGEFDLVTMNPPYIAASEVSHLQNEIKSYEPLSALTDDNDGLHFYRRLADVAKTLIKKSGIAFVEMGFGQSAAVLELFHEAGLKAMVKKDLAGIDRVVSVEKF